VTVAGGEVAIATLTVRNGHDATAVGQLFLICDKFIFTHASL
jgi:hypothetical protein